MVMVLVSWLIFFLLVFEIFLLVMKVLVECFWMVFFRSVLMVLIC